MCGILGTVNFPIELSYIRHLLQHRGPDRQSIYKEKNINLAHFRLSIVDREGGMQPMVLDDRYIIIFNGEIYNHLELRTKFKIDCSSNSDTETLLKLYRKLGSEFLKYVDGMYALAIYDKEANNIFLARDKAGKKPLYIYQNSNQFVFASELNAIRELVSDLSINNTAIKKYLFYGSMFRKETPYIDVTEFPSATYGYYDLSNGTLDTTTWWSINEQSLVIAPDDYETAKEKVRTYFDTHVKNRMLSSDLEVGCFLSGGIDSGLATSFASCYTDKLKTFTVAFDGPFDEGPLAKQVANKYNTDHTEIKISFGDLSENIDDIISGYGEPFFDSSAIPSWYVSREAKKHVTVILNGDGADELFGGYRRYVPFKKYDFFKSPKLVQKTSAFLTEIMPNPNNKKSIYNYLYRLLNFSSKKDIYQYLSTGVDIFTDFEYLLNFDAAEVLDTDQSFFASYLENEISGLRKLLNLDFDINLFCDLLVKMDIATMAHSLEGRSPFLGTMLLDYVPTIRDDFKIKGKTTKFLLRDLAKDYLPSELITQPKRGFEIPLKLWTKTLLKEKISDRCLSPDAYSNQFISLQNKEKLINYKLDIPQEKCAKMIYTIFSLDTWYLKSYKI